MKDKQITLDILAKNIRESTGENITESDLIEVINKIAHMHQNKKFGYFTEEDIFSQVWVICLEQLNTYDPNKGEGDNQLNSFERWFNKIVRNRLSNFYRDKYLSVNEKHRLSRMNLINCLNIDNIDVTHEINARCVDSGTASNLILEEFKDFVEKRLSDDVRDIYHDCIDDENVSSYYRSKLARELNNIIKEWNTLHNGE